MREISDEARGDTDLVQLKLRFQERTRARLEAAAKENGTSLNAEIVSRLERSLAADERMFGQRNQRMFDRLADAISELEGISGRSWTDDQVAYHAVRRALLDEVLAMEPPAVNGLEIAEALQEGIQARDALLTLYKVKQGSGATPAIYEALGLKASGTPIDLAKVDEAIAECEARIAASEARACAASAGQRAAERNGRRLHRQWRADRKRKASKAYGA